ncbi:MAG: DUF4249 family protein [Cyclobacteriaceae bacterium]
MKYWLIILTVLILGCEEAFEYEPVLQDDLLVVEAFITNEKKPQEVHLSKTYSEINNEPPSITDALVAIHDGDSIIILTHDHERPGTYMSDSLRGLFGKTYTLYIRHEGKEYYAQATSAFGSPLEPLQTHDLENGLFQFIYQESSEPSMTEVIVSWEETDSLGQVSQEERRAFYYTLKSFDINSVFAPEKDNLVFPAGAQLFRRKYSLTDGHQDFIRSFLSEVDWRGGIFDVSAGNVLTNLTDGAVGYFSVSMVRTDTTIIE